MALNLFGLLGSTMYPYGEQDQPIEENPKDGEAITILGRMLGGGQREDMAPPPLGNRGYIEEANAALDNAPPRKGLFGVKGTLRDVLGTLGDAFLMNEGQDPLYRQTRRRERMGDAATGYTDSPEATMAAVERLNALGETEAAAELYQQHMANMVARANVESLNANRDSLINDRTWGNYRDARNAAARLMAHPGAKQNFPMVFAQIQRIAEQAGVSVEDLGISPDMTPEEIDNYAAGDMTVNQQEMLPRRDTQLRISQQNADSARINATRPRQGRAPNNTELFIEYTKIPKAKRTQEQQDFIDKFTGKKGPGKKTIDFPSTTTGTNDPSKDWSVRRK